MRVVAAAGRHYVPYDGAALSHASDYDLFSTYLPGFARCIEAGAPLRAIHRFADSWLAVVCRRPLACGWFLCWLCDVGCL